MASLQKKKKQQHNGCHINNEQNILNNDQNILNNDQNKRKWICFSLFFCNPADNIDGPKKNFAFTIRSNGFCEFVEINTKLQSMNQFTCLSLNVCVYVFNKIVCVLAWEWVLSTKP